MNTKSKPWSRACFGALLLALGVQSTSKAADWPGWRGPTGLGYTEETDLPISWDAKTGKNIVWKTLLHGGAKNNPDFTTPGWSSPIVWNGRIFLTTATWPAGPSNKERRESIADHHVLCIRAENGELLWDTVVPKGKLVVTNEQPTRLGRDTTGRNGIDRGRSRRRGSQ